ncbi:phosphoglycerate kinase, partial [Dolichospermum sp. ST_sed3]|nr:phosphoglycerate kinase [Dolichospermum sp. ST_sed3]
KLLASHADIFIQDAFSNCHRDHASMTSVTKFIPSCTGFIVEKEVETINDVMSDPKHPYISIIGGLKADKLGSVKFIAMKADKVLIAGALAFTLLKAKGYKVGMSKIDSEGLEHNTELVHEVLNNPKVVLPVDAVIADKFDAEANSKIVKISEIPDNWMALDLGPESIREYTRILGQAKTVVWNGPIGVFEFKKFAHGTEEIAKQLVELSSHGVTTIVGGGDSAEVVHKLGCEEKLTHVSSGGGASLEMFEGKQLIAISALEENYVKFKR